MSDEWLKVSKETPHKPEIIAIAAGLDPARHPDDVFGKCFRLWSWADSHTTDGHARGVTQSWVDAFVGCAGFAAEMSKAGWLVIRSDAIIFPNFGRHMSESAKQRALATKRKQRARERPPDECHDYVTLGAGQKRDQKRKEKKKEENPPPPSEEGRAEWLAREFQFLQRGRKEDPYLVSETFQEMLRVGYSFDSISGEVKDDRRDRSERLFKLKERLEKRKAPPKPPVIDFAAEAARLEALNARKTQ